MAGLASTRILIKKIRWFLYENLSGAYDLILLSVGIPVSTFKAPENSRILLYTGEFLPPRIARMAKWTKRSGNYYIVLLCHKRGYFEKFSNKDIDKTLLFRNKWHLKRIIRSMPTPYIAHGFAPKSRAPYQAMQFLKQYHPGVPFISDYQDVLTIYYGIHPTQRWLKQELPYEKLCMQQADGMVAHSLEPCEGMKVWGIKKKNKRLFFPLYCDNDSFKTPDLSLTKENIHLVYAGGVVGSHRDKRYFGATQFHWLIDDLTSQKIHFHIYPSPTVAKADFEEYEQIALQNEYFHFHPAVSQSALSGELSKYHYGLMPFYKEQSNHSELKYKYSTTLKLFNYSEAGIPILVGNDVLYEKWIIERYKLGITVKKKEDFKDLRRLIERESYAIQLRNVMENREKLSLQKHIPRLINYYEEIREKTNNN